MFVNVDLLALAANSNYFQTLPATSGSTPAISLLVYNSSFQTDVLGPNATARLIADYPYQAFHEAGIYHQADNTLSVSSNFVSLENPINVTKISLSDYSITETRYPTLYEANGGTSYYPPGTLPADPNSCENARPPLQVWADEGDFIHPGSLVAVDPATNVSTVLLTSFLGRNFSSPNDVRQHPITGDLWFTDADYGYFQYFRPVPTQPKQVYRFEPATGVVQVVADGFVQPNGIEFSPDLKTVYVTDTGAGEFQMNGTRPANIYAFDVVENKRLQNRRTFAWSDTGFPDGIHATTDGNVWAGCGDGVHVWNPDGVLLGKVFLGETSNNFAFIPGAVLIFSNYRLWIVENIIAQGREVCKDFGFGCP